MTTFEQPDQPSQHHNLIKMQQPETAKNVHVYLNGDKYFAGRKFVVNRKHISDFNGFLNQVTAGIKAPFGAVRNVYTPTAGHRVNELQQLQSGMHLVAGGVERFRKIEYNAIASKRRPLPRRNYLDIKLHHNRMNVSARWRKYVKDPCQIFVYGNGDINAPALRLLLIPRCMKTWDLVLGEITEKISLRTGQAVRKLYDMNFRLLGDPSELENGHYYVAVGTEKLKKFPYGEMHKALNLHSPRKTHHQPLPPIKKAPQVKPSPREEGEQSYAKMYAQKKQHRELQEETTVMGASAATGYRPLKTKKYKPQRPSGGPPTHEGESVFHAKPVKVKRASGHSMTVVSEAHPPSEESDGVFRTNSRHIKAEEVDEDEDTRVDLPIDQVPADEVEEENLPSARDEEAPVGGSLAHQMSDTGEEEYIAPVSTRTDEVIEKEQHPEEVEEISSREAVETKEEEDLVVAEDGAGEPVSTSVEPSVKDPDEEDDLKAETPVPNDEEASSAVIVAAGSATIDLQHATEDTHEEEVEVLSQKDDDNDDEGDKAPVASEENDDSNPIQHEDVDGDNVVDDPVTAESSQGAVQNEDAAVDLSSGNEEVSSSPVPSTTEDKPDVPSDQTDNETSSSPEKLNPAAEDDNANQKSDSDQEIPPTEVENVAILNGIDKISNNSESTPALPEDKEEEKSTHEEEEQSKNVSENNEVEDEQLDRNTSVTPSSPKPRNEEQEKPSETEQDIPEVAAVDLPASPRSEADGADVAVPDDADQADKDTKNDTTKDDDNLPAEESQRPEEEQSTARPASEAATVEDDQAAAPSPAGKPSTVNGSATAVPEATV